MTAEIRGLPAFPAAAAAVANGIRYIAKGWACETEWEVPTGCGHATRRAAGACRSGTWMRYTELYLDENKQQVGGHTERQVSK